MAGKVIYQKKYLHEDLNESSSETSEKQIAFNRELVSDEGFIDHPLESITLEPLPQKEEGVQRFIQSAIEISDLYELDTLVLQRDGIKRDKFPFTVGKRLSAFLLLTKMLICVSIAWRRKQATIYL